jgi:hypothetical protein
VHAEARDNDKCLVYLCRRETEVESVPDGAVDTGAVERGDRCVDSETDERAGVVVEAVSVGDINE